MVEAIEDTLGKNAEINKISLQLGDVNRTFAKVSKAKEVLGYNPSCDIEDGIRNFVEWYKASNDK